MEGYLFKQSDTLKQWRRRWFRLVRSSLSLDYKLMPEDKYFKGSISLVDATVGRMQPPSNHQTWFCFFVRGPNCTYVLAAQDSDIGSRWLDLIVVASAYASAACAQAAAQWSSDALVNSIDRNGRVQPTPRSNAHHPRPPVPSMSISSQSQRLSSDNQLQRGTSSLVSESSSHSSWERASETGDAELDKRRSVQVSSVDAELDSRPSAHVSSGDAELDKRQSAQVLPRNAEVDCRRSVQVSLEGAGARVSEIERQSWQFSDQLDCIPRVELEPDVEEGMGMHWGTRRGEGVERIEEVGGSSHRGEGDRTSTLMVNANQALERIFDRQQGIFNARNASSQWLWQRPPPGPADLRDNDNATMTRGAARSSLSFVRAVRNAMPDINSRDAGGGAHAGVDVGSQPRAVQPWLTPDHYTNLVEALIATGSALQVSERQREVIQAAAEIDARRVETMGSEVRAQVRAAMEEATQRERAAAAERIRETEDRLTQEKESVQEEVRTARLQCEKSQKENADLQGEIEWLKAEMARNDKMHAEAISKAAESERASATRVTELENELATLRSKVRGAEDSLLSPFWGGRPASRG